MTNRPTAVRLLIPLPVLTLIGLGLGHAGVGDSGKNRGRDGVRLENLIELRPRDPILFAKVCLLPDNETVVVVGGKPRAREEESPTEPTGAILNVRDRSVRPFTNGHRAPIEGLASPPEGSWVVTTSTDKDPVARLWDIKASRTRGTIDLTKLTEAPSTFRVACFPDGHRVAVTAGDWVSVFDTAGGAARIDLAHEAFADRDCPEELAVSRDGKRLACTTLHNRVVVWDVKAQKVLYAPFLLPKGADHLEWSLESPCFTGDGAQLLVVRSGRDVEVPKGVAEDKVPAERRGLFLIDVANQQVTPLGLGHQIGTFHCALRPGDEWLATVGQRRPDRPDQEGAPDKVGEVRVYHWPTRALALKVQFPFEEFSASWVGFTPDGKRLIAVAMDGKLRCWDFVPAKP